MDTYQLIQRLAVALAIGLLSAMLTVATAKIAGNHSLTILRASDAERESCVDGPVPREGGWTMTKPPTAVVALALALLAVLPGVAAARLVGNHNLTLLRG